MLNTVIVLPSPYSSLCSLPCSPPYGYSKIGGGERAVQVCTVPYPIVSLTVRLQVRPEMSARDRYAECLSRPNNFPFTLHTLMRAVRVQGYSRAQERRSAGASECRSVEMSTMERNRVPFPSSQLYFPIPVLKIPLKISILFRAFVGLTIATKNLEQHIFD